MNQAINFEQLVETFQGPLYRFGLSLAKNPDDACDLVQQTFVLWAQKGHQLRDTAKVKSWLFTTLYREFLGGKRRESRARHEPLEDVDAELPSVSPEVVETLDSGMVMEALQEVAEVFRIPLSLFYMNQLSYQEIAHSLDVPIGTVMSRISRGKKQLREILIQRDKGSRTNIVDFDRGTPRSNHG